MRWAVLSLFLNSTDWPPNEPGFIGRPVGGVQEQRQHRPSHRPERRHYGYRRYCTGRDEPVSDDAWCGHQLSLHDSSGDDWFGQSRVGRRAPAVRRGVLRRLLRRNRDLSLLNTPYMFWPLWLGQRLIPFLSA